MKFTFGIDVFNILQMLIMCVLFVPQTAGQEPALVRRPLAGDAANHLEAAAPGGGHQDRVAGPLLVRFHALL